MQANENAHDGIHVSMSNATNQVCFNSETLIGEADLSNIQ